VRLSYRYICSLTCCWKQFLVSRGLSADLQKYSKNEKFSLKNWKKCLFSILRGQNRPQWAGEVPDVFLVCHEVLLLTNVDHLRKKFLTRRIPFPPKMNNRICQFLYFFRQKNLIFEVAADISDINCCRHFWQHDGDPLSHKYPMTRIQQILCVIRKVTSF